VRQDRRAGLKSCRREEVSVDVTDPGSRQAVLVDEKQDFLVVGDCGLREIGQVAEHCSTLLQASQGDLASYKWVRENLARP